MFERQDLMDFVGKIINQSTKKEETKRNLQQFRSYLDLTKMADENTLSTLDRIIACTDELIAIKEKLGSCDVGSLLESVVEDKPKKLVKRKKENVHYHHYHRDSYSTSYEPSYWSTGCSGQSSTYRGGC